MLSATRTHIDPYRDISHYSDWPTIKIPLRYAEMDLSETFGINVRRIRTDQGMTLEALAHEAGLAYTYVGQIERGLRNPTLKVVERIAEVLKIAPEKLLVADSSD